MTVQSQPVSDSRFADTDMPEGVDGVETAVFDGEAVLFRESTRMVHRLNTVAGSVWLLCDGATLVSSMAGELGEVFGVDADGLQAGVHEALAQLADEGLLVGFEPPNRIVLEPVDEVAPDGSRILTAPPDP